MLSHLHESGWCCSTCWVFGKGCLLAKVDIESAFHNIPVHPEHRHLLGMMWNEKLYIGTVLPFGLRSTPKIFNSVADALQWIAKQYGISYLEHFLDDFITAGGPTAMNPSIISHCWQNICSLLGQPLKVEKWEGPATCLIFFRDRPRHCAPWGEATKTKIGSPAIYNSEMEPFKML